MFSCYSLHFPIRALKLCYNFYVVTSVVGETYNPLPNGDYAFLENFQGTDLSKWVSSTSSKYSNQKWHLQVISEQSISGDQVKYALKLSFVFMHIYLNIYLYTHDRL
jgi:hypothetical protein